MPRLKRTLTIAALMLAAAVASDRGLAQTQPARPAPAAAPVKPYKPVAIKPPPTVADPSFEAFRKQLAEIAKRKDRAALARLIVAQGFFWEQEKGDTADKKKPGIDNLAKAMGLDEKDGAGWDMLGAYAGDPTGMPLGNRKGVVCAPADPSFNEKELESLIKSTQTDISDWGYPAGPDIEVRAAADAKAAVVEKLGAFFIRVVPEDGPQAETFLRIITPSGKTGFVPAQAIIPLGNDQLCYAKDAGGWKITGFIGGEE
jgi:hypothetical protein